MAKYDAFISYSHAKDKPIAGALQSAVQKLGKPWYRLRVLRVFRDDTSLAAAPGLWPTIEQALGDARFMILLASPEAAKSPWVAKEVEYWLTHKSIDTLLIGLTAGGLSWDRAAGDFNWSVATPLPPPLKGRFPYEPRWVDLTAFRDAAGDKRLAELAADFAAAVRGVPKEDLLSEELRQQRRALHLAWTASAVMLVLASGVGVLWLVAAEQRDKAERTLTATTENMNSLVIDVATKLRRTLGIPVDVTNDILTRTRKLQEQLIGAWQSNPRLESSQAIVRREIAQTHNFLGDTKASLDSAQQARVIMDRLLAGDPRNPELLRQLSLTYNRLGEAYAQIPDPKAAYEAFERALAIRKGLAAASASDVDDAERALALSYERTGDALFTLDRRDEARAMYQANFDLREKLARAEPLNNERQGDLAIAYDRIGARVECDAAKVLNAFRDALRIREALVAKEPRDANWQRDLGANYFNVGRILLVTGQRAEAAATLRKSVGTRAMLAADNPEIALRHTELVNSLMRLAEAGDAPRQQYDRALKILADRDAKGKLTATQSAQKSEIERRIANEDYEAAAEALPSC